MSQGNETSQGVVQGRRGGGNSTISNVDDVMEGLMAEVPNTISGDSSESNLPLLSLLPRKISEDKKENRKEKGTRKKNATVAGGADGSSTTSVLVHPPAKKKIPPKTHSVSTDGATPPESVSMRILRWFHVHNKPVTPQVLMNELGSQFSKAVVQKNLEVLYQEEKKITVKDYKKIRIYYLTPGSVLEEEGGEGTGGVGGTSSSKAMEITTTFKKDAEGLLPNAFAGVEEEKEAKNYLGFKEEVNTNVIEINCDKEVEEEEENLSRPPLPGEECTEKTRIKSENHVENKENEELKKTNESEEESHGTDVRSVPCWIEDEGKSQGDESVAVFPAGSAVNGDDPSEVEKRRALMQSTEDEKSISCMPVPPLFPPPTTAPSGEISSLTGAEIPLDESHREEWVTTLVRLHREVEDLETQLRVWGENSCDRPTSLAACLELQDTLQREITGLIKELSGEEEGEKEVREVKGGEEEEISSQQGLMMGEILRKERNSEEEVEDPAARNPALFAALVGKYREARQRWRDRKEYVQRMVDQMRSGSGASLSVSSDTLYQLYGVVTDEMAGVSWKGSSVEWRL